MVMSDLISRFLSDSLDSQGESLFRSFFAARALSASSSLSHSSKTSEDHRNPIQAVGLRLGA